MSLPSNRFLTLSRFNVNAPFLSHVGSDFAIEPLPFLWAYVLKGGWGSIRCTKEEKSIILWTVTKWSKGRGLLFREKRWIHRTTHARSPATAGRYPWLCVPWKCQNLFVAGKFPGFWKENLEELTTTVITSPTGSLLLTCVCFKCPK